MATPESAVEEIAEAVTEEAPVAEVYRWTKGNEGLAGGYFSDDRSSKKAIMGVRINNAKPIPITPMVPISVLWCTW